MDIDMIAVTKFGHRMAKHFFNCEPQECIDQLNEVLDSRSISILDYNFLLGVRRAIENRLQ